MACLIAGHVYLKRSYASLLDSCWYFFEILLFRTSENCVERSWGIIRHDKDLLVDFEQ